VCIRSVCRRQSTGDEFCISKGKCVCVCVNKSDAYIFDVLIQRYDLERVLLHTWTDIFGIGRILGCAWRERNSVTRGSDDKSVGP